VVITGGGAMLKNLPQLVNFKTAMDVRIGYPNEHLHGEARNEINQPMFATSVGLIMKGFEFLDNYKQEFSAGQRVEKQKNEPRTKAVPVNDDLKEEDDFLPEESSSSRMSFADKLKARFSQMFEFDDQAIS
jgi:cell division protein FtsA